MNRFWIFLLIIILPCNVISGEILLDEFDGSTLGASHGISYVETPNGQGAVFSRENESRVQYAFESVIPKQGTIEFLIKVEHGYRYKDYTLQDDLNTALIFTTDVWGGDVYWPGSTWLYVYDTGKIYLRMIVEKYSTDGQNAIADGIDFKFGQWHAIGISFGSEGQYIMLDGQLVASEPTNTQELGRGGNHSAPVDIPTIGESVSAFWSNNQHEGGFEGIVDRFRVSDIQKDWVISKKDQECQIIDTDMDGVPDQWDECPSTQNLAFTDKHGCEVTGIYTEEQMNQMVNKILGWDVNNDGTIGLVEAIQIIREASGFNNNSSKK